MVGFAERPRGWRYTPVVLRHVDSRIHYSYYVAGAQSVCACDLRQAPAECLPGCLLPGGGRASHTLGPAALRATMAKKKKPPAKKPKAYPPAVPSTSPDQADQQEPSPAGVFQSTEALESELNTAGVAVSSATPMPHHSSIPGASLADWLCVQEGRMLTRLLDAAEFAGTVCLACGHLQRLGEIKWIVSTAVGAALLYTNGEPSIVLLVIGCLRKLPLSAPSLPIFQGFLSDRQLVTTVNAMLGKLAKILLAQPRPAGAEKADHGMLPGHPHRSLISREVDRLNSCDDRHAVYPRVVALLLWQLPRRHLPRPRRCSDLHAEAPRDLDSGRAARGRPGRGGADGPVRGGSADLRHRCGVVLLAACHIRAAHSCAGGGGRPHRWTERRCVEDLRGFRRAAARGAVARRYAGNARSVRSDLCGRGGCRLERAEKARSQGEA